MIDFKNNTIRLLAVLFVIAVIIGLLVSLVLINMNKLGIKENANDVKRTQELKQVQSAIELYYKQAGAYPQGTFFSVWDSNYKHTTNYWSGGDESSLWSTALYDALVKSGYLASLPSDPINSEGGDGNYLGDGAITDQGYIYWSDNGQHYILGTNLEKNGASPDNWGNYQIKGGSW